MARVKYALVDLDGTLCNTTHRRALIDKGREGGPNWKAYSMACADDPPIGEMLFVVRALYKADLAIVLASGRDEAARGLTKDWLNQHGVVYDRLLMRPEGARMNNVDLKVTMVFELEHEGWQIAFAIDDYPAVLTALEERFGIPTLLAWSDGRRHDIVELARREAAVASSYESGTTVKVQP